jgi:hypothetical protein
MPEGIKLSSIHSFYTFIENWNQNEKKQHANAVIEEAKEENHVAPVINNRHQRTNNN